MVSFLLGLSCCKGETTEQTSVVFIFVPHFDECLPHVIVSLFSLHLSFATLNFEPVLGRYGLLEQPICTCIKNIKRNIMSQIFVCKEFSELMLV